MGKFERLRRAVLELDASTSTADALARVNNYVPKSFTLVELCDEVHALNDEIHQLSAQSQLDLAHAQLVELLACLQSTNPIQNKSSNSSVPDKLAVLISSLILPVSHQAPTDSLDDTYYATTAAQCRKLISPGLNALQFLAPYRTSRLPDLVLSVLLAFTDPADGFADSPQTAAAVREVVSVNLGGPGGEKSRFARDVVLEGYLHELFAMARPAALTSTGRVAQYSEQTASRQSGLPEETIRSKPWKYRELGSIPSLSWVLDEADDETIAKFWHRFTPILMSLVDDSTTRVRLRGLQLLIKFIDRLPAKIGNDAGLYAVFEQAVWPILMLLPDLTPEEESLQLLPRAYDVLFCTARKLPLYTKGPPKEPKWSRDDPKKDSNWSDKLRLFDKMMWARVLPGYHHAKDHIRIVAILVGVMGRIVKELKQYALKHLKDMIPVLSAVITDPFATSAPKEMVLAIETLQIIIFECVPAFTVGPMAEAWSCEVAKILVSCWLHLVDDADSAAAKETIPRVKEELKATAQLLSAVMATGSARLSDKTAPLILREPSLSELFAGVE